MNDLMIRARLQFRLHDESKWFADRTVVGAIVDAILATRLAAAITHAGTYGKVKPAKDAAAIKKAVVTGKRGTVQMLDAPDEQRATLDLNLDIDPDVVRITAVVHEPVVDRMRATLLGDLEAIGLAAGEAIGDLGGLDVGHVHPMGPGPSGLDHPQVRPPIHVKRHRIDALLDWFDPVFHASDHPYARPEETAGLVKAKLPSGTTRHKEGNLVAIRWIDSLADTRAVQLACGRHEVWMAPLVEHTLAEGFNQLGDTIIEMPGRREQHPFTFVTSDHIGYKAIVADDKGTPDAAVWAAMASLAARPPAGIEAVRLIVPARKPAIKLWSRAKEAGFDAVLYPEGDDFLDPNRGWWAE